MTLRRLTPLSALLVALSVGPAAAQSPFPRPTPYAGAVLTAKGGEELRFDADAAWRYVVPQQALNGGDTLRTNAFGNLAILFADQTQLRLGRNSTLTVKEIARTAAGETVLSLTAGTIFSRATRGGSGVSVETAAATAGVRGTEWSLSVEGARTTLAVMEGAVALTNPQGSVLVAQGEGGEAVVGQAPRKIKLVDFEGRQQLLLYRELKDFFFFAPASGVDRQAERATRQRILALPAERRSAEDLLTLAEAQLFYDGAKSAAATLAEARRRGLDRRLQARAALLDGYLAGRAGDWAAAETALGAAMPGLDRERREIAAYALWTAIAAGHPTRKPPALPDGATESAAASFARAQTESFVDNAGRGAEILADALRKHPRDGFLRAGRAMLLMADGRDKEAKAELDEGLRVDPDEPLLLSMRARYRRTVTSELKGAVADLTRAIEIAPGNHHLWTELALAQRERRARREAEQAFLKALELNPDNALILTSYALFLVRNARLPEADAYLKRAETVDPTGLLTLGVRANYLATQGKTSQAQEKLLAAAAVDPSYADSQSSLAVTSHQLGDRGAARQALDNADRYDPDNVGTSIVRSILARDDFRADEAVIAAREAVRRSLARGGDYETFETSRNNGTPVNSAMRFVGLNDWGRFYGDRVFDPFRGESYYDLGTASRSSIVSATSGGVADQEASGGGPAEAAFFQAMLLNPLSAAYERKTVNVYDTPFAEVVAGGSLLSTGGRTGWASNIAAAGKSMEPVPVAISLEGSLTRPDSPLDDDRERLNRGSALLGAQVTPYDNVVLSANRSRFGVDDRLVDVISLEPDREKLTFTDFSAGWSHEFGYRNVLQAAVSGSQLDDRTTGDGAPDFGLPDTFFRREENGRARNGGVALSHLIGVGDVTLRYGFEGGRLRRRSQEERDYVLLGLIETVRGRTTGRSGLGYADATWDVAANLKVEGGVFLSDVSSRSVSGCSVVDLSCTPGVPVRDRSDDRSGNGRIGVAWAPFENQWLRAAYRRDVAQLGPTTLAPLATVGILPNDLPTATGSPVETLAFRWDAEWSPYLFTAIDYQRQKAGEIFSLIPESVAPTVELSAKVRRLSASANIWLTHGVGLSLRYARTWSEVENGVASGLAYAPKHAGRIGLTVVSRERVRFTVAETIVGSRPDARGERLSPFATTDVTAQWTSPDRRLVLSLQGLNLFDRRYVIQSVEPVRGATPVSRDDILGRRRTVIASAELRF